ncbi:MAG TPA: AI-2E family transporter [Ohtaekwangia sp.]
MTQRTISPSDINLKWLQYVVFVSLILYFGRDIFIPISFAVLVSFVSYPFCVWLEKKGMSRIGAIAIAVGVLMILFSATVVLLITQFIDFMKELPALQDKLGKTIERFSNILSGSYGITPEQQKQWVSRMMSESGGGLLDFIRQAISTSALSATMMLLIPVYVALILYYRHLWVHIIYRFFPGESQASINEILSLTIKAYYNFIKGMALVYLLVGILNSVGLLILGIPHAILFGFIASVLTFIPYVGILIGSLLPIAIAWITYDSIWYPLGIVGIFVLVQYLEANVIFPLAVSSRLKVNALVMLIAIFCGGVLWGVAGMILFVPFVGILKLIADHNPKLKTLAMVLGTEKNMGHK